MGILDWLRSRRGGGSGDVRDPDREVTPGGSVVYRYEREPSERTLGIQDDAPWGERGARREAVYGSLFGCGGEDDFNVYHEIVPFIPHVDVYAYPPREPDRPFYTLITSGMSDLPMTVPESVGREGRRAELVLYCREPKTEYAQLLGFLAHFPHDEKTWLGFGHTLPNGQPAAPLFCDSALDTVLFVRTAVEPDTAFRDRLVVDGDPVNLLCVLPITTAECELKLERGVLDLLDVLDRANCPIVLDERRPSAV